MDENRVGGTMKNVPKTGQLLRAHAVLVGTNNRSTWIFIIA